MRRRFSQVDVFGAQPYTGNPLAVVIESEGLDTHQMQQIANWTNLSETTFLLAPTDPSADYRVRIFTPVEELPFAGHPTLGSARVWLDAGGTPRSPGRPVQECGAGLVQLVDDGNRLSFAAPPLIRSGPLDAHELDAMCSVLGLDRDEVVDAAWVDNGPGWAAVLLGDVDRVLALTPEFVAGGPTKIGVVAPYPQPSEVAFEVRAFFDDASGVCREDPVTGSLNASLAQWLVGAGVVTPPFTTSQGTVLGRMGRPRITQDADGALWVGGSVVTCIDGHIDA